MRNVAAASVLVDQLSPPSDGPVPAERLGFDILRNFIDLERITYTTDLVVAGARPEHLEQQPLPVLIVAVRGDDGEPFGMDVMRALNPHYHISQFLMSPLGEQLTPELANFMRLGVDELRKLRAQDVRQLGWPLSRWNVLFGVGVNFLMDVGLRPRDLKMDPMEALASAALPDDQGEPLFRIEL
jgi:hypothetical protein